MPYNNDPKSLKEEQERKDKLAREAAEEKKAAEAKQKREAEIRKQNLLTVKKTELRMLDLKLRQREGDLQGIKSELRRMSAVQRSKSSTETPKTVELTGRAKLPEARVKEVHAKLVAAKTKLEALERDAKQLELKTREVEGLATREDTAYKAVLREETELVKTEQSLEGEAEKLQNEIRILEIQLSQHEPAPAKDNKSELEAQISRVRSQIDEETQKLAKLELELKNLEGQFKTHKTEAGGQERLDIQLETELKEKKTRLERLVSKIRELTPRLLSLKQKTESTKPSIKTSALERELTQKKALVVEIKKLINNLETEERSLIHEVGRIKVAKKVATTKAESQKRSEAAQNSLVKVKELDAKKLEQEIDKLTTEKETLAQEIKRIEQK